MWDRNTRWTAGALAALAVMAVMAVVAMLASGLGSEHAPPGREHPAPSATPVPGPEAAALVHASEPVAAAPIAPTAETLATKAEPLRVHVERLLASGNPQDAMAAYYLVRACTGFNVEHYRKVFDVQLRAQRDMNADEVRNMTTMCGSMTERERQARLDYLALAVKGGVSGAASLFAAEGPFGDRSALQTRPDDPLVKEWKTRAVAQLTHAAEEGDPATLVVWGIQKLYGSELAAQDKALGYGYLLAVRLISADRRGPNDSAAPVHNDLNAVMRTYGEGLSTAQRAAAVALARRIADKVKRRR